MEQPDEQPFGEALAREVSDRIFRGFAVLCVHRDYCGVGLLMDKDGAFAAEVYEGLAGRAFARWGTQAELASFLAEQSDRSLARGPGSAPGFETDDPWREGNQTLTRSRFEAFVAEVDGGSGQRSSHFIDEGPAAWLMLEEAVDRTALLRFLRDELNYQLKEAHGMLRELPARIFGVDSQEAGEEWVERFSRAGGRCTIRRKDE